MWPFKRFDKTGYSDLLRRIITLEIDQVKIFNLMNSLRGLVNRTFGQDSEPEEDLSSPDGLDELRKLKKDGRSDKIGSRSQK